MGRREEGGTLAQDGAPGGAAVAQAEPGQGGSGGRDVQQGSRAERLHGALGEVVAGFSEGKAGVGWR